MRHAFLIMSLVIALGLGILALTACTNSTPPPTSSATSVANTTPSPQASSGDSIEAVYSTVASIRGGSPLSPLFGDWPEDRAAIDRLALALDTAVPITPTEHLEAYDRGRYLENPLPRRDRTDGERGSQGASHGPMPKTPLAPLAGADGCTLAIPGGWKALAW